MFISSDMRGDISLLNIYCCAAMIEVASGRKNLQLDGFFGPQTAFE